MRVLIASSHMLRDAETAWDAEAAAGRVSAWRDTSALRAVGGSAERRGAVRDVQRDGGIDEGAAAARADAAATALAEEAALDRALGVTDARGLDGGPSLHAPPRGCTPPSIFALTPDASINVGHVRFCKSGLYAHLGLTADNKNNVKLEHVILGGHRRAPLDVSFTTDGVVLCVAYTVLPEEYSMRVHVGVANPKLKGSTEREGGCKGKAPHAPRRALGADDKLAAIGSLSRADLEKIAREVYKTAQGHALRNALKAALASSKRLNVTRPEYVEALKTLNLTNGDIRPYLTGPHASTNPSAGEGRGETDDGDGDGRDDAPPPAPIRKRRAAPPKKRRNTRKSDDEGDDEVIESKPKAATTLRREGLRARTTSARAVADDADDDVDAVADQLCHEHASAIAVPVAHCLLELRRRADAIVLAVVLAARAVGAFAHECLAHRLLQRRV